MARNFTEQTLVFVATKVQAHRLRILMGLNGINASEMHGDLSQQQRLEALESFRHGLSGVLVCTDLAARGLDIPAVSTVLHFDMPKRIKAYIHRVGRTARAGREGRSVALVTEADRTLLKEIHRHATKPLLHRIVPKDTVEEWQDRIDSCEKDIKGILEEERMEREFRKAEMELRKSTNMIDHADEILARPRRSWFQSKAEKMAESAKEDGYDSDGAPSSRNPPRNNSNDKKKRGDVESTKGVRTWGGREQRGNKRSNSSMSNDADGSGRNGDGPELKRAKKMSDEERKRKQQMKKMDERAGMCACDLPPQW